MDKKRIFQHYSKIFDSMLENSLFFPVFFQSPTSINDIEGSIDDPAINEGIFLRFGISRGCLIDEEFDYVVKFDINCDNNGDSMCAREVEFFREAQRKNLDKYFTSATYIGTYTKTITFYDIEKIEHYLDWDGYYPKEFDELFMKEEDNFGELFPITIEIPLYAYPRVETYNFSMLIDDEETKCKTLARQIKSPLRQRNLQIAMEFVHRYGMEEYVRLSDFLALCGINDLHYKNVGALGDDFVISDYSGYHSGYAEDYEYYSEEY